MPIYLLRQIGGANWNEFDAKVIRADTEKNARSLANKHIGDEGKIWADPKIVSCVVLDPDGRPEVIFESFDHGLGMV